MKPLCTYIRRRKNKNLSIVSENYDFILPFICCGCAPSQKHKIEPIPLIEDTKYRRLMEKGISQLPAIDVLLHYNYLPISVKPDNFCFLQVPTYQIFINYNTFYSCIQLLSRYLIDLYVIQLLDSYIFITHLLYDIFSLRVLFCSVLQDYLLLII